MEDESSGLPLFPVIVALLVVAVAGTFYIVQLRAENAVLRAELELARQQASAAPASAPAPVAPQPQSAPAAPLAAGGGRTLTDTQRSAMLQDLQSEIGLVRDVWFAYSPGNAESMAFQQQLQSVFESAGWTVRHAAPASFTMRPGIYFLMADENPPSYVLSALQAFESAGIEVSAGRGYRAFYEEKKAEDPTWRGFPMEPDQAYIVAVGAKNRE